MGAAPSRGSEPVPDKASLLDDLPGAARIWVFGLDRKLPKPAGAELLRALDGFLEEWNAHGAPLRSGRSLVYGWFLIVGVDEAATPPSGCSIDALAREAGRLASRAGTRFVGAEAVWYRGPRGSIRRTTRPAFRAEAEAGRVSGGTIVFDNAVTRLSDVRAGRWEGPASERWHAALLPRPPERPAASRGPTESGAGTP